MILQSSSAFPRIACTLVLVTIPFAGCFGNIQTDATWEATFTPELDLSKCGSASGNLTRAPVVHNLNGEVASLWPVEAAKPSLRVRLQINETAFFGNIKCVDTSANGVLQGSFVNQGYTGTYRFSGQTGNVTLSRTSDCRHGGCDDPYNGCQGPNCGNDCQGPNCGQDCGPNGCNQGCDGGGCQNQCATPNCNDQFGGSWHVSFQPLLDVTSCASASSGPAGKWSSQQLSVDYNGNVNYNWPAYEMPHWIHLTGQMDHDSFDIRLSCTSPSSTNPPSGQMTGQGGQGGYEGRYSFGAGLTGSVRFTRQAPATTSPPTTSSSPPPSWTPGGVWNVQFTPVIDVSICTNRHLTWTSQALSISQTGAFDTVWSPSEPETLGIVGSMRSDRFEANLRCIHNPNNDDDPTGQMSGGRDGDGFSGQYSFYGPTGTFRITRGGSPSTTSPTSPPPGGTFSLLAPSNGATGVGLPVTFRWTTLPGAGDYRLDVATTTAFADGFSLTGLTGDSIEVGTGMNAGTRYYWRVTASTSSGTQTATNNPYSFTVQGTASPSPTTSTTAPPAGGAWTSRTAMPAAREAPQVAALGTDLYVAGGHNGGGVTTLYKYTPSSDAWTSKASVPVPRWGGETGTLGGTLVMAGGWGSGCCPSSEVYQYDPSADAWTSKASAPTLTACGAAAVIAEKMYITTPCNGNSGMRPFLQVYDPATNAWASLADSPVPHSSGAIAAIGGKLYAAGGFEADGVRTSRLDVYDPATNTWSPKASMSTPRAGMTGFALNGRLYAAGGNTATTAADTTVLVYDPATDAWTSGPSLLAPRTDARGAVLGGSFYLVGGNSGTGSLSTMEVFTP